MSACLFVVVGDVTFIYVSMHVCTYVWYFWEYVCLLLIFIPSSLCSCMMYWLGLGLVGEYKTYRILGVWTWKFGMLKVYVYVNDKNRFKSMTSTQKKYLPLGWLRRQNVFSLRINGNRMNIFSHFFSEFGAINPHVHQSMFILNIRNGFRGQMFVEFLGRIWVGI